MVDTRSFFRDWLSCHNAQHGNDYADRNAHVHLVNRAKRKQADITLNRGERSQENGEDDSAGLEQLDDGWHVQVLPWLQLWVKVMVCNTKS